MAGVRCGECGARYKNAADSCSARFDVLLSLDHSRQEPWGSRHGQAFAALALQHPMLHTRSLDRAWQALYRVYVLGEPAEQVFASLRAAGSKVTSHPGVPARPEQPVRAPKVTIADLGDFAAESYAEKVDEWCRAALAMWGVDVKR